MDPNSSHQGQPGYPPQQQGYPPQQAQYPQPQGYPHPLQQPYPPPQQGYNAQVQQPGGYHAGQPLQQQPMVQYGTGL